MSHIGGKSSRGPESERGATACGLRLVGVGVAVVVAVVVGVVVGVGVAVVVGVGVAVVMVNIPPNTVSQSDITEWHRLEELLRVTKAAEMLLRTNLPLLLRSIEP